MTCECDARVLQVRSSTRQGCCQLFLQQPKVACLRCCACCVVRVLQVPYFPPLQSAAQFTPKLCSELIQAAAGFPPQQQQHAGAPQPPGSAAAAAAGQGAGGLQVHSIKQWVMSAEVAEEYGAWGNRLLLAGDAAHRWVVVG